MIRMSLREFQRTLGSMSWDVCRKDIVEETIIDDIWTDIETGIEYLAPHRLMGFRGVSLPGMRKAKEGNPPGIALGAILVRQNAMPKKMNYKETLKWLDDGGLYEQGCSEELRGMMVLTRLYTRTHRFNTITTYQRRCFLPSPEEMGSDWGHDGFEISKPWSRYRNTPEALGKPCEERILRDASGVPQKCWLRFGDPDNIVFGACVREDGACVPIDPYPVLTSTPGCVIVDAEAARILF